MSKKYTPTEWVANKTVATADVMNNIEQGIVDAHNILSSSINYVTYEMFGAKCDGEYDDGISIKLAHEYANEHNLPVKCDGSKTYYIKETSSIPIMTNTDWQGAKIIIDETVGDLRKETFIIKSKFDSIPVSNPSNITLKTTTNNLPQLSGYGNCFAIAYNDDKKHFIRKGANSDSGYAQRDVFTVDNQGNIMNEISWDFDKVTSIRLYPIDKDVLYIENGNFISIQNTNPTTKSYVNKNIICNRSNVVVRYCSHVTNENAPGNIGEPSRGFFYFSNCANIVLENVNVTPKTTRYVDTTPGGTYELEFNSVVGILMNNVNGMSIEDDKWGCHTSNYTKDVVVTNCKLNRFDAHKGIWNLTIRDCTIGYQGIRVNGGGKLIVDNCDIYSIEVVALRGDYGSSWNGDIRLTNIRQYSNNKSYINKIISYSNDRTWDFGFDCYFCKNLHIENYYLDDSNAKDTAYGHYIIFNNVGDNVDAPYKYYFPRNITLKNLSTKSSKGFIFLDSNIHLLSALDEFEIEVFTHPNENSIHKKYNIKTNITIELDNVELYNYSYSDYTYDTSNLISSVKLGGVGTDNYTEKKDRLVPHFIIKNCKNVFGNIKALPSVLTLDNCTIKSLVLTSGGSRNVLNVNNCVFEPNINEKVAVVHINGLSSYFNDCLFKIPLIKNVPCSMSDIGSIYLFLSMLKNTQNMRALLLIGYFKNCYLDPAIKIDELLPDYKDFNYSFGNTIFGYIPRLCGSTIARPYSKNGIYRGFTYYDTDLRCLTVYDGTNWRKFDGTFIEA